MRLFAVPGAPLPDFLGLLRDLQAEGVDFAVVGGTAAVLHGASTATFDLDIVMQFSEANCAALLRAVEPLNPRLSHTADKRPLRLGAAELSGFRNLYLSTDLGRLDVLGALPPIADAAQVLENAEQVQLDGQLTIRVVSLRMLIDVKAAMGRPKDKLVELELRAIADARKAGG